MHPIYVLGAGVPSWRNAEEAAPPPADKKIFFPPGSDDLLRQADALIGGRTMLTRFANHPAEKYPVTSDVDSLYSRIDALRKDGKLAVVLCSGDPLYFGLGARLAERFGPDAVRSLPGISSLQAAAAFLGVPWEQVRSVSLHGRHNMLPLAHALLSGDNVCLLCDAANSPARIASWLLDRGCPPYRMHVLDDLRIGPDGAPSPSAYRIFDFEAASRLEEDTPARQRQRVILFLRERMHGGADSLSLNANDATGTLSATVSRPFGLDDASVDKEQGIITKQAVRAAGLAALGIEPEHTVWDIGAGSGAVSLEASRLACRGQVFAFEAKESRLEHIRINRRRFGALNMEIIPGEFPDCLPDNPPGESPNGHRQEKHPLPRPHRIFVGGGLGGIREKGESLLQEAWKVLLPGGRILIHCVLLSSLESARSGLERLAGTVHIQCIQTSSSTPVGKDIQLKAHNPVFLALAEKKHDSV